MPTPKSEREVNAALFYGIFSCEKKQGFIGPVRSGGSAHEAPLEIANACPRRWLVVLHLELNPQLAQGM
ncbi:hypothetical protein AB4Y36_17385 [Paraburkholderia sp. BR10936]|uniref:hypothetical protein n=1 Tax=Paraburkholderia sp. BR10936 TaxID=3236993 RepID=UPI0034D2CDDF